MDWLHGSLDLAGLIPGLGEVFDGANAVIYAMQGEWMNAALYTISMVPEIGDLFGKGRKIVLFLEKLIINLYELLFEAPIDVWVKNMDQI